MKKSKPKKLLPKLESRVLKHISTEDLKSFLYYRGISDEGSREALIKRIKAIQWDFNGIDDLVMSQKNKKSAFVNLHSLRQRAFDFVYHYQTVFDELKKAFTTIDFLHLSDSDKKMVEIIREEMTLINSKVIEMFLCVTEFLTLWRIENNCIKCSFLRDPNIKRISDEEADKMLLCSKTESTFKLIKELFRNILKFARKSTPTITITDDLISFLDKICKLEDIEFCKNLKI